MVAVCESNGDRIPGDDNVHRGNLMHEFAELGPAKVHIVSLQPVLVQK